MATGFNAPKATFTVRDNNSETSNFSGYIPKVGVGDLGTVLTNVGNFRDALEDMILGEVASEKGDLYNTILSNASPTDPNAQRERKMMVFYADTVEYLDVGNLIDNPNYGKIQQMEIPTARVTDPDGDPLLLAGNESYDFTNPYVIAFVTAFEALYRSQSIRAVEIIDMQLVGRNL